MINVEFVKEKILSDSYVILEEENSDRPEDSPANIYVNLNELPKLICELRSIYDEVREIKE